MDVMPKLHAKIDFDGQRYYLTSVVFSNDGFVPEGYTEFIPITRKCGDGCSMYDTIECPHNSTDTDNPACVDYA